MASPIESPTLRPLVAGIAALILLLGLECYWLSREDSAAGLVQHTLEVEAHLWKVLTLLTDGETGQRGFIITGDESYLTPYDEADRQLDSQLHELGLLTRDNPAQVDALDELHRLIAQRFAVLQAGIQARRQGSIEQAFALVRTGEGKQIMDGIRAVIAAMAAEEDRLLAQRRAQATLHRREVIGGALLTFLAIFGLGVYAVGRLRWQATQLGDARDRVTATNQRLIIQAEERAQIEAQLRQAQKMEAIGQLTGGLAHDFNNMLAIVMGSLNLTARRLERGDTDVKRFIEAGLDGAHRAAALTAKLLAFARRQPLEPRPLDMNKLVGGMSNLLARTLGEQIRLETVIAGGLWRTYADQVQLESALLNLAINARDAMPRGGTLTIETANAHLDEAYAAANLDVTAGQYAMLAVTDTGAGMEPDVAARAFDPFFTTKGVGQGSGLGLSQVYGFVKQSNGHVKIYSEIGHGTTVKIYLPRHHGEALEPEAVVAPPIPRGTRQDLILVVEDEPRVRATMVDFVLELGYQAIEAGDPASALRLVSERPDITLMLTDVVMPQMTGKELADRARKLRPDLKLLFTTGYTRNAIVHNGVLDPGVHLLSKPFAIEQLALKLRDALAVTTVA